MYIYYAGHGMMKNYTYAVLNAAEGKKVYPLEALIRNLAKIKQSYVVGVFDCCREEFLPEDFAAA